MKDFFFSRFQVPLEFWTGKQLLKKVHSVWVCSEKAGSLSAVVDAESVGILLLLELNALKPSRQGLDFLKNR